MRTVPPPHQEPTPAPSRWRAARSFLLTLGVLVGAFWAGARLGDGVSLPSAGPVASEASLRGHTVRDEAGALVPLAPTEGAAVVMVSSESCGSCAASLRDLARMSDGRPLPRLHVLALEGSASARRMLDRHGVRGAAALGPADDAQQTVLSLQLPGTPTFLLVDADGRVRATMPGYPGAEGLRPWLLVMTGEREAL